MDRAMSQKRLAQVFDEVVREVTERASGIRLLESGTKLAGELCTVYTSFQRGYRTGVSLCAERSLFTRLTQRMMQTEEVSPQEVEEFSREYFNALCGRIVSQMYPETKIPARFDRPSFHEGRYSPRGRQKHFSIRYTSDGAGNAELVHHLQDMEAADTLPE